MEFGEHTPEAYRKGIALLDKLLARSGWDSSRLLTASQKRLKAIRDGLQVSLDQLEAKQAQSPTQNTTQQATFDEKPGWVRVYVSLHQVDGARKRIWEQAMRSLSSASTGRPMYTDEAHVRQFIQGRPRLEREGYACVYIREGDMLTTAAQSKDKNGHPLSTLKSNAWQHAKVVQFVHANANRYKVIDSKLVAL